MLRALRLSSLLLASVRVYATWIDPAILDACPGYSASNVTINGSSLTADLTLAGTACNVFGTDITNLKLEVTYETSTYPSYLIYFSSSCYSMSDN
jgi:alpha-glucosidase